MTVTYKGLDCLADSDSDLYSEYKVISQSGVTAWAYMMNYGYYCLYFGAALIGVFIVRYFVYRYYDWQYRNSKIGKKLIHCRPLEILTAGSRYISYKKLPLILSRIAGLPPTLGTLILLSSSALFVLCVAFIPHFWYRGCQGFGSPPLAVRTGIMATSFIPFLIIISGKTNFISQATGISYEKLNIFHQALGWFVLFLSLAHTIPFLIQPAREGGSAQLRAKWDSEPLYRNGVPPLIFSFLLCIASIKCVKKLVYEVWWHSHWVMGLAFVGTLANHCYGELATEEYIWGTIGFWAYQIIYRLVVKTTLKPNDYSFKSKEAVLTLLPNEIFEVSVTIDSSNELTWKPGQHIFIRFIHGRHTLDNHPFSIISIPEFTKAESKLKLIIKPQRGLTRKLFNLLNDEKESQRLRCFIDGPYGGMSRDPLSFDKLVLIASGTGVSVTMPFLTYAAQHFVDPTSCIQQVSFIWVVNDISSLDWIKRDILRALEMYPQAKFLKMFDINIFVTNSKEGIQPKIVDSSSKESTPEYMMSEEKLIKETITGTASPSSESRESLITTHNEALPNQIKIRISSKPDLKNYLMSTELLAKNCFIVSGSGSMQNDCGNAISNLQKRVWRQEGIQEVYLHSENFAY